MVITESTKGNKSEGVLENSESLISCLICKKRRIRCGRELPSCSYCARKGIACNYPSQTNRRSVSTSGINLCINKIKLNLNSNSSNRLTTRGVSGCVGGKVSEKAKKPIGIKFILFEPMIPANSIIEDSITTSVILDSTQLIVDNQQPKFQTHLLLMLTSQIVNHDKSLIPQLDDFLNKLELGIFGGQLKFNIHLNQEWIKQLFLPEFEQNCINSYFIHFHHGVPYFPKLKYFNNPSICPILKSVIILVGYSNLPNQYPELLKYLNNLSLTHLKKNFLKVKISHCQALFIFSYWMLFQGLAKQSLVYYHQGYLMASALGIDRDIIGLNPLHLEERRCIRFTAYSHDSHLCSTLGIQSYYLYLAPTWKPLNPHYHKIFKEEDLLAECFVISREIFKRYWTTSTNLMNKYSQLNNFKNYKTVIETLSTLFEISLQNCLQLYEELKLKYNSEEDLMLIKQNELMHISFYNNLCIILNSQFTQIIDEETLELNKYTKQALKSAEEIYQITLSNVGTCLPMFYHYLSQISLFYIKLILNLERYPSLRDEIKVKLGLIYRLFLDYRKMYNLSGDLIEVIQVMVNWFKIKF